MFVSMRTYTGMTRIDEVLARGTRGLVPILTAQPGFRGYFFFACDDGTARGVSVFDTEAQSDAAYATAREWVASNLKDLAPHPPSIVKGEVTQPGAVPREVREGDYAIVQTFTGVAPRARALQAVRERVLPDLMDDPGLRGFYSFRDDTDESRMTSVVFCATQQDAERAGARAWDLMHGRLPDIYPNQPTYTGGKALVARVAPGRA
jgi:heme-degrading monooxygenase HmoA